MLRLSAWEVVGMRAISLVLAGALAFAWDASAASFDCAKAVSPLEKTICSDALLSDLDAKLERTYRRALDSARQPEALKSEQRAWLATERKRCSDVACLRQVYQRRLTALEGVAPAAQEPPYSFTRPPFVSPRIVNDLTTWLSDQGQQVVAINVTGSQGSNRYSGELQTRKLERDEPYVYVRSKGPSPDAPESEFGYQHVGRTASGVDVLLTKSSGGGSGVFTDLLLVKLEYDTGGISAEETKTKPPEQTLRFNRRRLLIKSLGSILLGDRWSGQLKVTGNDIRIGKNTGFTAGELDAPERVVHVEYSP
jgi:uncharacterized protein